MFRGPLQDCSRVFSLKGARDALRNLEAGVSAVDGPGRLLALAIQATKSIGPSASHSLEDQWAEGDACLGALRGRTEERVLVGFRRSKDASSIRRISDSRAQLKGTADGEIWCLLAATGPEGPIRRPDDGGVRGQRGPGPEGDLRQRIPGESRGLVFPGQQPGWLHPLRPDRRPPADQGVVSPYIHDLFTKRAVCVQRPDGHAKPAPGIQLRQTCGVRWRSCDDGSSK